MLLQIIDNRIFLAYDHKGRMVRKTISRGGAEERSISYLWDNWNIIRESVRNGDGSVTVTDNIWGLDIDGSLQGAGGVGGLLAVMRNGETYFLTYDANGNVSDYVSTNGEIVAHYDYPPFGEILVQSGDLADTFTHRFSTKPWCPITGLYEYQMRKYRPEIGRWLSRDLLEGNDSHIYTFCINNSITLYDIIGMQDAGYHIKSINSRASINSAKQPNFSQIMRAMAEAVFEDLVEMCPDIWAIRNCAQEKKCCSHDKCVKTARKIADAYAAAVVNVANKEFSMHGDVLGGTMGNYRAHASPAHGEDFRDADFGNGLKCTGWTSLGEDVLSRNSDNTCFGIDSVSKKSFGIPVHAVFGISGPYCEHIEYDPWPSGGLEL